MGSTVVTITPDSPQVTITPDEAPSDNVQRNQGVIDDIRGMYRDPHNLQAMLGFMSGGGLQKVGQELGPIAGATNNLSASLTARIKSFLGMGGAAIPPQVEALRQGGRPASPAQTGEALG